jgi:hypothetical protein
MVIFHKTSPMNFNGMSRPSDVATTDDAQEKHHRLPRGSQVDEGSREAMSLGTF